MGFSEDDRIRSKNRTLNEAYELYEALLRDGDSLSDIESRMELLLASSSNDSRNNIYLKVLDIVRRSNEKVAST